MGDEVNGIVWEDPPPIRRGTNRIWERILLPLIEHEGRWAMVREYDKRRQAESAASNLRTRTAYSPAGRWEFASRGTKVYARYMGPE